MRSPGGSRARMAQFGRRNLRTRVLSLADFARTVLMAVIFFVILTPVAVALRIFGRSGLSLAIDRSRTSYWQKRDAARQGSLRNQY